MNISNLKLDDIKHTFVIAEAGSNWKCGSYEEDLQQAKELIKVAAKADAVKFQTYKPETIYVQDARDKQLSCRTRHNLYFSFITP